LELPVRVATRTVDHGGLVWEDVRAAGQEAHRRELGAIDATKLAHGRSLERACASLPQEHLRRADRPLTLPANPMRSCAPQAVAGLGLRRPKRAANQGGAHERRVAAALARLG